MNKKLLFSFWVIILLACSVVSPSPTATPTVRVIPSDTPVPTATVEPPTPTMTETATPAGPPECVQFHLSPEECANSGLHTYTFTGIIHTDAQKCRWEDNKQTTITKLMEIEVKFSESGVEFCYPDLGVCQGYEKSESNSYFHEYVTKNSTFTDTLKIDGHGMNMESENPDCPTSSTYILSE